MSGIGENWRRLAVFMLAVLAAGFAASAVAVEPAAFAQGVSWSLDPIGVGVAAAFAALAWLLGAGRL